MRLSIVAALASVLLALPLGMSPQVAFAQDARLTGSWVLNEEESHDPHAGFERTMRRS